MDYLLLNVILVAQFFVWHCVATHFRIIICIVMMRNGLIPLYVYHVESGDWLT